MAETDGNGRFCGQGPRCPYDVSAATTTGVAVQAVRIGHEGYLNSVFLAEAVGRRVRSSWRDVRCRCQWVFKHGGLPEVSGDSIRGPCIVGGMVVVRLKGGVGTVAWRSSGSSRVRAMRLCRQ